MQWNGKEWVAEAPPTRKASSRVKRLGATAVEAGLVTALAFGLIAGSTFAAKGGAGGGRHGGGGSSTGGSGTVSLVTPPVVDKNGNGAANWSDVVRFNVSTGSTSQPWVSLTCSQGGVVVAQGTEGYFAGALDDGNFGLYSPQWTGGAADCIASLKTYSGSVLASASFHVGA